MVQNAAARFTLRKSRRTPVIVLLTECSWLSVALNDSIPLSPTPMENAQGQLSTKLIAQDCILARESTEHTDKTIDKQEGPGFSGLLCGGIACHHIYEWSRI